MSTTATTNVTAPAAAPAVQPAPASANNQQATQGRTEPNPAAAAGLRALAPAPAPQSQANGVAAQGQPSSQPRAAAAPGAQAPSEEHRDFFQALAAELAALHPSQGGSTQNIYMVAVQAVCGKRIELAKAHLKSYFGENNDKMIKYLENEKNDIFCIKEFEDIGKLRRELFYTHVLGQKPPAKRVQMTPRQSHGYVLSFDSS